MILQVLACTIIVLLLLCYLQFRWQYRHILSAALKLPCPPALPLIGNAHFFIGDITSITKHIIKFSTQFKGLFCIWVGPVPLFVVADPADTQIILNSSNTLEKDSIYKFLKPYLGNGLLTAPVPTWKKYRRLLSPLVHPTNIEMFIPVFNELSHDFVLKIAAQDTEFDPRKEIFNSSIDAIMKTVIARNALSDDTKNGIQYLLHSVGRLFTYRLFKVWLHIDWLFQLLYGQEVKQTLDVMANCTQVFNEHWADEENIRSAVLPNGEGLDCKSHRYNTMCDVMFSHPPQTGEDHDWLDEVTTMVVGATDTVVAAVSFCLLSLANRLDIQDKVRAEVLEIMRGSDHDVTLSDLNRMTYLGQTIMETMRYHGVFPVILRKATKDTKLSGGHVLPAGSRIMVTLHAMGWNPDTFPQPEQFIPERFCPEAQQDSQQKRHQYAFLPFSAGPRNCLGKMYAMVWMKTILARILIRYRVRTNVRLEDIDYELKVVMFSKRSIPMSFDPIL